MPHPRSRQHLEHFIQFAGHTTTVNGLISSTVTAYIAQLEQDKYTAATIRRRIVTLRLFCDFWTQKGELKESPFWRLKFRQPEPRTPDPIETPQLQKPLSHAIQSIRVKTELNKLVDLY
jgi:site-specific recombinase XerD